MINIKIKSCRSQAMVTALALALGACGAEDDNNSVGPTPSPVSTSTPAPMVTPTPTPESTPTPIPTPTPTPVDIPVGLSDLIACPIAPEVMFTPAGLPIYESNPGAPIVLYVDYDGGLYRSSSLGDRTYSGYNRTGSDPETFNLEEQADLLASLEHLNHYFAMFDVNVTTVESVREASKAWSWIMITEEESGGRASLDVIGRAPYARAYSGSSTVRKGNQDKSRRIAHEIGHNFGLYHSGVWDSGDFYKWEDWPEWDFVYGTIMGGGGKGLRNGWSNDYSSDSSIIRQDSMSLIRTVIQNFEPESDGWRADDFADTNTFKLCDDGIGGAYREAILEKPSDVDVFVVSWGGGPLQINAGAIDVSAALLEVQVINSEKESVLMTQADSEIINLPADNYIIEIRSRGGYGEIGSYYFELVEQ